VSDPTERPGETANAHVAAEGREPDAPSPPTAERGSSSRDRMHSAADQGASATDQLSSDSDRDLAARDQHAADRDQAVADREQHEAPPDPQAEEDRDASRAARAVSTDERATTAAARAQTSAERARTARHRDELATLRDRTAEARDRIAQARDEAAEARDRAIAAREARAVAGDELDRLVTALRALRTSGAQLREQAVVDRVAAAADRQAAATDRRLAALDRHHAGLDDLTGTLGRGAGRAAATQEISRARRTGHSVVVVLFDVDNLKAVNDNDGHAAGDALLRAVAKAIASSLRSYDVTSRWGGDEFVCVLSNVSLEVAAARVEEIRRTLDRSWPGASVGAGLAQLEAEDTLESLIARADQALYRDKASINR
jgi:diguanylate cyclase (GGDEF)-like protein